MDTRTGTKQFMAGRPLARIRKAMGIEFHSEFVETIRAGKKICAEWLPDNLNKTKELADGILVERTTPEGPKVYKQPPNFLALQYLIDRVMGKPATESNAIADRLNLARAMFLEQQIEHGWIEAVVREMTARGDRTRLDIEMLPQQFVTEADEEERLRKAIMAMNEGVLKLTPEQFRSIAPEVSDPANVLQQLKGLVGRSQSDALSAAFGEETIEEDEEEDG